MWHHAHLAPPEHPQGIRTPGIQLCHRVSLPSGTATVATGGRRRLVRSHHTITTGNFRYTSQYHARRVQAHLRASGRRTGPTLGKKEPQDPFLHFPCVKNRHSLDHFPASSNSYSTPTPGLYLCLFPLDNSRTSVDLSFSWLAALLCHPSSLIIITRYKARHPRTPVVTP